MRNVTYADAPWTRWSVQSVQPVVMLVTDSWMTLKGGEGDSYRSGATFSGQGRLKDILAVG